MGNGEWGPATGMGTGTGGKILNGDGGRGACPRPHGDPLPSLIARDYEGRFTGINIGKCSVIVAELWGVLWGFLMGQSLGYHNISLERDLLFVPPNFIDTPTLREKKK